MQETLLLMSKGRKNKNASSIINDNSKSILQPVTETSKHLHIIHNSLDKRNKIKKHDDKYPNLKREDKSKRESINDLKKIKNLQINNPKNGLKKHFLNHCIESPRIRKEEKNKIEREIGDFQEKTSEVLFPQSPLNDLPNFGTSGKSNLSNFDFPKESKDEKFVKVNNSNVDENYNMKEYLNKMKQIYSQKEKINNKLLLQETETQNILRLSQYPVGNPQKKYPLLMNDVCRCINPGISHACLSRMPNDDSFGILNPMFAETDPENSPKLSQKQYSKTRSKTKGLHRAYGSLISDSSRTLSYHSLTEFRQKRAEQDTSSSSSCSSCIVQTTRSKTYSDFLSALSPVDSDLNYSYFYPSDLREEIMFPLPDSMQKGVFRNPNAKEASFIIGKPQQKKRGKPINFQTQEIDEQTVLKDVVPLDSLSNDIIPLERLKVSNISPLISLKFGLESQSSFESQELEDRDNFGRQEYLEYKSSSDSSRRNSENSDQSECHKEFLSTSENPSKRRSSSVVNPEALTISDVDRDISQRKLSLPCVPRMHKYDISSIYIEDLQNSLTQIYQPLPAAIFGSNVVKINSNKSSVTEDGEQSLIEMKASAGSLKEKRIEEKSKETKQIDSSTQFTNANLNQSYSSMKTDKNFPITDIQNFGLSPETSISPTISPSNFGKSIYSASDEKPIVDEVSDNMESANSLFTSFAENEFEKTNSLTEGENIQTGARRKRREGICAPPNTFPALDLDLIPDQTSSLHSGDYSKLPSSSSSRSSSRKSSIIFSSHSLASSRTSLSFTSTSSSSSSLSSSCSGSSSESSSSTDSEDMLL